MQHEDAFVYLSAIQGEQCLSGRVPALCQGRFVLCPGSGEQQSQGQAEGSASPALPDCGFVLFHQAWGHMWAPCQVPEAGDFISQSFLLPGAESPSLCHRLGLQFQYSVGTAPAPTEGSVQLRLAEDQDMGDPLVLPQGSAQVAAAEYSQPFLGNPQVSACPSTLGTAPQPWLPWDLQAGVSAAVTVCAV